MTDQADGPTGTVTFLFTDIEGSTRLELELGTAAYGRLRERHRAVLRAAFARHGGREESTDGDAFFVTFDSAREAVLAAVDGQRGLAAEDWPDGTSVRVRMGLHAGEAIRAGGDLVGYDINRAARIAAAGHGEQVVASRTVRALAGPTGADTFDWLDLGLHRLKDLQAPEHLAQVVADGLRREFPPVRSLDIRPNNLPTQLTPFVGRERELAEAEARLDGARLLTLTGPGGTGKTRLSLQLAAHVADRFPDGVWFVPLEPVRDRDLVAPTIARTLGLADDRHRPAVDAVAEAVADGRVLLVLDNFEQVVDAAPVVAELLRRCPRLAIVVSSRAALRVSGEQEHPVPGMPAPPDPSRLTEVERLNLAPEEREPTAASASRYESVRLFALRAEAVRPGWELTDADAPAVAAICARLQGMPLAIELAAARMKLLSPQQILARLGDRLALLAHGSRDLPARQQTLRGAIAWSYDLLSPEVQRLLRHLSVFVGGWDLESAEAVCGTADELGVDVLEGLGELVDQSLVRREEAIQRFSMFETIREFAAEALAASGEQPAVRRRHAAVFLDLAERAAPHLGGGDQRVWLDLLERDHDNLRAALGWAGDCPDPDLGVRLAFALWRFWQQRGYLNEARVRLEDLEARGWDLAPLQRARLAEACGGVAYWQADHEAATHWYDVALAMWRELGDRREIANALYNRSYASLVRIVRGGPLDGSEAGGRAMLEEALETYRALGDVAGEGNILWALASYHFFLDEPASAVPLYRESLERHRATGQQTMEAWSLHMLAVTLLRLGETAGSTENALQALALFRAAGDVAGITLVLDDLAATAVQAHDLPRAGRLWGAARRLQAQTGANLALFVEEAFDNEQFATPRSTLSPDDLERYGAEGAAMSLDEAVAYAVEPMADPTSAVP